MQQKGAQLAPFSLLPCCGLVGDDLNSLPWSYAHFVRLCRKSNLGELPR